MEVKMAIRFDKNLNQDIYKVVRNYNARRKYMISKGYHNIPDSVTVSELKSRYTLRNDLTQELKRLRNLKTEDLQRKIETDGGVKAVKWKYDYIKQNQENAIDYFERELKRVSKRQLKYPGESRQVDLINAKINLLKTNIDYMNQDQFRSAYSTVSEFMKSGVNLKARYRGFLHEVEEVMNTLGYSEETKNKFFNKFKKLTPSQFLYAYNNNDLIARVYQLYFRKEDTGNVILNTTDDTATDILDTLLEQADDIIQDAIENAD